MRLRVVVLLLVAVACDDAVSKPAVVCTVASNDDGSSTITCGEQSVVVNAPQQQPDQPAPPPPTLIRTESEPAGSHCVDGGKKIDAGPDTNANGVLDDGEVDTTSYLCADAIIIQGNFQVSDAVSAFVLSQADEVTGTLNIAGYGFATLPPMPHLRHLDGDVSIFSNAGLQTIDALGTVDLGGALRLTNNSQLQTLGSGSWKVAGTISIQNNPVLTDISALSRTTALQGDLYLADTGLASLTGLDNLSSVSGDLTLATDELASIAPLASLQTLGGRLNLGPGAFTDIDAFSRLTTLHDVDITVLTLTSLAGLQHVTSAGNVLLSHVPVTDLSGFGAITSMTSLEMQSLSALTSLDGLNDQLVIDGDLTVGACAGVASIANLAQMHIASIIFDDDDALVDLTGLTSAMANVQTGAGLTLQDCDGVTSLDALADMTTTANLTFDTDAQLATISLPALTTVNGTFTVSGMAALTTIDVPLLQTVGPLHIDENPELSQCAEVDIQAQMPDRAPDSDTDTDNLDPCSGVDCGGGACVVSCDVPDEHVCL